MRSKEDRSFAIAGKVFKSRLILGTGKYANFQIMREAIEASGTELVTVAIRRVNFENPQENLINYLPLDKVELLPNTAGCYTAEEAIRVARLASELCDTNLIKLEVIGHEKTLLPDILATIEATKILAKEGFIVMPYTNSDPVAAMKLLEAGAACVMPLASPIGSGQGFLDFTSIELLMEIIPSDVPLIVDAGIGVPSDASQAMELGADAVLVNTAIAKAQNPVLMAEAIKLGVEAGRKAFLAGRIPKVRYASASSPLEGRVGS